MAPRKDDVERLNAKRAAVAEKVKEIAPHADALISILDEHRVDLLLLGFGIGELAIPNDEH